MPSDAELTCCVDPITHVHAALSLSLSSTSTSAVHLVLLGKISTMPSAPQRSPSPAKLISATTIARIHTRLAFTAFSSALVLGCALHYKKIVKNGVAGYPQEWCVDSFCHTAEPSGTVAYPASPHFRFPSVSATIGDWYPERNLFQVLIALTSGIYLSLGI
jgi:hypothetical protein